MSKRITFVSLTDTKRLKSEMAAGDGTPSLGKRELPNPDNIENGYLELTTPEGLPSPRLDRVIVNFGKNSPRGFYGIELGYISRPVAFVKRVVVPDIDMRRNALRKTCHPNLVNLTDVFINQETVYFTYEKSGLL
ncbi:hypothetical protein TSTA_052880 [Talaromyces stipitatus ATCC 10500]|uniref:Protein kinase domain-containing protein n=1 Tax=Talaromyces stipitatus (strain ATCC 10500 / CBS 375.48 / QM 6759 / NRRL 1006) TaxID=441959 RepID=B8MPV9_TALSN|nr:uncharacterized protein TSTA_052880 [Talaromyces stipitatus ATCC 10500]EED12767.1 hypothetical protein TSTA_052880 [Talaromyces stipitatus ATCC 10500]